MNQQGLDFMSELKDDGIRIEDSSKVNDNSIEYYHEYMRLYIANVVLTNQLKELLVEKNELNAKLNRLERSQDESGEDAEERKKRSRRQAQDIERHFKCPIKKCIKQYGAEGSLNQHIKLKHPELLRDRGIFFKSNDVSNQQPDSDSKNDD